MKNPVALVILDGLGNREGELGNAVKKANLPNYHRLMSQYPHTEVEASGLAVGLPEGQMGNSEVGHLNIGAGRVVYQELTRISRAIETGDFFKNEHFLKLLRKLKTSGKALHLMGLVSDGGVHSHMNHIVALLKLAKREGLKRVCLHCFLDGRDTPPQSGLDYIKSLEASIAEIGVGRIVTISGRYYAMDRDQRWERVQQAYDAMTLGKGRLAEGAITAVEMAYSLKETDEFVIPTVIPNDEGEFELIEPDDGIIFFNFRPDRAREMTRALMDETFEGFKREKGYFSLNFVSMTSYDKTIENAEVAYPPQSLANTLGEYISKQGIKQLRMAETEKYAHVTFFFNGGVEIANIGEQRKLVPSPKVATYDLQPEMSAYELTEELIKEIDKDQYDFIVVNFANPDMVGHTGIEIAVIKALETVDECLGKVIDKLIEKGGKAIVTSDHGNAEEMIDEVTGGPVTSHTINPVPLILVGEEQTSLRDDGKLCDIAPTLLEMMNLSKPLEMTGKSLIKK
ncbi:phosphoglycerate mutase, 2,3-bisphosphoglycerate-independent [Alkaliphilus metalliredigens QYMF]|uniref:2,3-bisphosphoglycerate-independent phosphoglycerate mutase n=1 Tax=Alkaliphilus metalliredigens (strain QYMF) TaxID=293826 RepID=A6TU31_ALKMQ|nr:2,3-bisphosphoglycerate-independent phosphoglycerate mutase [Alkaliphilus metalliredigens]ABR49699.1 phosphoglycerate mutase, 2,3-bisphosphoglycerate-independent [Alkaliphilus metalliredigens QYMF]